ncbi:TPA: hypothetical protein DCG86_04185 [Candidatus Marinimicrobia bacterium]|nr:MAG: hypothetical protein XD77_0361 [Marinimicrobia bacterium 46_47]KUK93810.1 MAG: hypothetical protein XE04_0030 [Marinimicrobia bacterium 46_43]HAE87204.1 hypothetical protein [Candidatus Neomarinimicrobiota bacterium]HBY19336.1 hypothetical protein [Candidatus Neomarinimicrobiota bacterium]
MAKIELTIDEFVDLYTRYFEAAKNPVRNLVAVDSKTVRGEINVPSLSLDFPVTLTFDSYMKPNILFKIVSKSSLVKKLLPIVSRFVERYQNNIVTLKMPYIIIDTETAMKKIAELIQVLDVQHDGEKFLIEIGVRNI